MTDAEKVAAVRDRWSQKAARTSRIYIAEWLMRWIENGDLPNWEREGDMVSMRFDGHKTLWRLTGKRDGRGGLEAVWPD